MCLMAVSLLLGYYLSKNSLFIADDGPHGFACVGWTTPQILKNRGDSIFFFISPVMQPYDLQSSSFSALASEGSALPYSTSTR